MSVVKNYEKEAIKILLNRVLSPTVIASIVEHGEFVKYEYTGSGYLLTLRHPDLPKNRLVCSYPKVVGISNGVDSGFVVFLQNHELTLECHSWGEQNVPENYRNQAVRITIT